MQINSNVLIWVGSK